MVVSETVMTSRNGKLKVGMTNDSLKAQLADMGLSESDRAAKKLQQAFNFADGLGDNGVKDGIISEEEITSYDKEIRKKNIKTGLIVAGGALLTTALIIAGVRYSKFLNNKRAEEEIATKAFETKLKPFLDNLDKPDGVREYKLPDKSYVLAETYRSKMGIYDDGLKVDDIYYSKDKHGRLEKIEVESRILSRTRETLSVQDYFFNKRTGKCIKFIDKGTRELNPYGSGGP